MDMEPRQQATAKKLWNIARIVVYVLRKGLLKSKLLMLDLSLMMKRGKIAGKAIGNLMFNSHYSGLRCRSDDVRMSYVTVPLDYEFSCSNSPAGAAIYYNAKRSRHNHHHRGRGSNNHNSEHDDINSYVGKVFEMFNSQQETKMEASPLALPGFGKSPTVRQLRITDSPFPLKDNDQEDVARVNKAAEEFIKKFYDELKKQRIAIDSPSPCHVWAR